VRHGRRPPVDLGVWRSPAGLVSAAIRPAASFR
jgi:hypothetical protein